MEESPGDVQDSTGGHHTIVPASEGSRTRETLKYAGSLIRDTCLIDPERPFDPQHVAPCSDASLTAFAQLGALRLNVSRCVISLFDRSYQHVIAEATQSLPINTDAPAASPQLRLCGTAMPRGLNCPNEHVLGIPLTIHHDKLSHQGLTPLPPILVVADLAKDERFSDTFYMKNWPQTHFYAGIPIRSKKGVNIGVYHVYHDSPRSDLEFGEPERQFLRDMANIVWSHLESRAAIEAIHRGERMVRGLGSFVEGQSTLSSSAGNFQDATGQDEGTLNQNQQGLQRDHSAIEALGPGSKNHDSFCRRSAEKRSTLLATKTSYTPPATNSPSTDEAPVQTVATTSLLNRTASVNVPDPFMLDLRRVFSRAANIVRESVEVQGALFLDASVGSFGGLVEDRRSGDSTDSNGWPSNASSSNDDVSNSGSLPSSAEPDTYCDVFGYSTSDASSIDGTAVSPKYTLVPERLLKSLLRRYPTGQIFRFDVDGLLLSGESDPDDTRLTSSTHQRPNADSGSKRTRRDVRPFHSIEGQAKAIATLFPGARSVVIIPLWDQVKERWFAGGFIWTNSSHRIFTTEGELSYLRAFSTTVMGEVHRLSTLHSDKVKGDFLSSLSHELRSPLHGVIAAVDLLHGTTLDVFQGDAIHIIETSGRTLLDTLDHLLDHSKVNTFMTSSKVERKERRKSPYGSRHEQDLSKLGIIALTTETSVDILVEEVVEAVFAGFNFQRMSVAQLKNKTFNMHADNRALDRLDATAASEAFGHNPRIPNTGHIGLVVYLDMDPTVSWDLRTQPGALRRVVMNLFGNALKFTQDGFVWITLRQVDFPIRDRAHKSKIVLTISDSGKGISEDYLRNDLFKPFTQEDSLAPGTGLGMSLVHNISKTLGGTLAISSQLGRGTTACVTLPLFRSEEKNRRDNDFTELFDQLRGLRICLRGFDKFYDRVMDKAHGQSSQVSESAVMEMLCRDWLGMQIIPLTAVKDDPPDIFLYGEDSFTNEEDHHRHPVLPTVIICQSALTAYAFTHSKGKSELTEFIAQPVGPRRLGRSLVLSLHRQRERKSAVASGSQESITETSKPGSHIPLGVKPEEDPVQSQEPSEKRCSLGVAGDSTTTTSASTDVDPGHNAAPEDASGSSNGQAQAEKLPLRSRPTVTSEEAGPMQRGTHNLKYLLVDDNDINLKILASFTKRLGHEYDIAVNGLQALQIYTQNPVLYPFILMDISMPLMDGLESTRKIREFERAERIKPAKVIALTGLGSATIQREAIASGMDLFLTKPVNLKSLQKILGGYTKGSA